MTLHDISHCARRAATAGLLAALALSLAACAGAQPYAATPVVLPQRAALLSGDAGTLNYTPWYIHTWELAGPAGSGIAGGGRNALPVREDGLPSGGSGMCCTSIPHDWQPDLKLTVRWIVDKKRDGKTPGYWYKAENVRIAQYDGHKVGDIWAIFLPGDRVRLMVSDGNTHGGNDLNHRPADSDPYIVQGVPDNEWNQRYRRGGSAQ